MHRKRSERVSENVFDLFNLMEINDKGQKVWPCILLKNRMLHIVLHKTPPGVRSPGDETHLNPVQKVENIEMYVGRGRHYVT